MGVLYDLATAKLDDIKKVSDEARQTVVLEFMKLTDQYVPYKTGALSKSVRPLPGMKGIEFTSDYAQYAFNPVAPSGKKKKYNTSVHPKAQGNPIEKSIEEHGDLLINLYKKEVINNVRKQS